MDVSKKINPFGKIKPMIYAYTEPGVTYRDGWTKIGYTEKQTVEDRIFQQTHTAGIRPKLEWSERAIFKNFTNYGEPFKDHDFHSYLTRHKDINREKGTEWFKIDPELSYNYFKDFTKKKFLVDKEGEDYILRNEQQEAVKMTNDYFANEGKKFLWNAKPRFGKTLTTYDLIQQMGAKKVLIVTNRPSIANSWLEDFRKFVGWHGKYVFVSESKVMSDKKGVITYKDYDDRTQDIYYEKNTESVPGLIAFESLQGLKSSKYFGGNYDKLYWMTKLDFDLLVIDESHEGVDTLKTFKALKNINRKHTLFLSGTPFKALGEGKFKDNEIFNWSYADEQEAKENWSGDSFNPYERMPKLNMFTYQMSNMIQDELKKGAYIEDDDRFVDYTFDLNEFFKTNNNKRFVYEEDVKKFIKSLTTGKKYPFSTPELRNELKHTLWILNRVDSAKALAKLLKEDEIFKDYEIVVAAGDGKIDENKIENDIDENSDMEIKSTYDKVVKAISENDKTITLTVGQLTVGVTIPEWSGVLMLSNMKSPASYIQTAFRAQNPCTFIGSDNQEYRKENAYVFDFDPARTLAIFNEFANNLLSFDTAQDRKSEQCEKNIKRLLNFFPVIGEDNEGEMVELNAAQVLSIPNKLKSEQVVRRGFLSNLLFQNIDHVIGIPKEMLKILDKLPKAKEQKTDLTHHDEVFDQIDEISVNNNFEVEIPREWSIGKTQDLLGEKFYEDLGEKLEEVRPEIEKDTHTKEVEKVVDSYTKTVKKTIIENAVEPLLNNSNLTRVQKTKIQKQVEKEIELSLGEIKENFSDKEKIARAHMEHQLDKTDYNEEKTQAVNEYEITISDALEEMNSKLKEVTETLVKEQPYNVSESTEEIVQKEQKKEVEDSTRAHLRGFARTIPSFIMAYGDDELRLENFDEYTEDDVFEEVTGITEEEFRLLRDGYDIVNPETGEIEHQEGFFDEQVFNESIIEFLNKRDQLADYFNIRNAEDIFDYIPPQKTNQIYTPKWVVMKMINELEENNPGCFDNPDRTFADLYMKSGLYIAEIVKRLYQSKKMKEAIPDDRKRIKHILEKQVYGMAPSRIIYLIATNYILGFDEDLKKHSKNFVQADAAEAAKNGTLQELVDKHFKNKE